MNNFSGLGRLVADPELRETGNGIPVVNFRIAIERPFKNSQGEKETDFISCVAWRQTAEFINNYFSKGRMIAITGSVQTRGFEDKQGNRRTATEVLVAQAYFTGEGGNNNNKGGGERGYRSNDSSFFDAPTDTTNLPFEL